MPKKTVLARKKGVIDAEFEDAPHEVCVREISLPDLGFDARVARRLGYSGVAREFEGFAHVVEQLDVRRGPLRLDQPCCVLLVSTWGDGRTREELRCDFLRADTFLLAMSTRIPRSR